MAFDRNLNIRVRWVLDPPPDIQKALGAASKGVMLDPFGPGFQQALTRAVDGMNTFGAAIGKVNALLEKLGGVGAKGRETIRPRRTRPGAQRKNWPKPWSAENKQKARQLPQVGEEEDLLGLLELPRCQAKLTPNLSVVN